MAGVTETSPNNIWLEHYVSPRGDEDWFRFELDQTSHIHVHLISLPADYDVYLYNQSGKLIGCSIHWGRRSEWITRLRQPAGLYYVRVKGFAGAWNAADSYLLRFTVRELQIDDAPNSMTEVTETSPTDANIERTIAPRGDVDWFRFELTKVSDINIQLTSLPADYDLYLYDEGGELIAYSMRFGRRTERIILKNQAVGVYYVRVKGFAGAWDVTDSYLLRFEAVTPWWGKPR